MVPYPGFIGPSYRSQSQEADDERLINLYIERMESDGAKARAVYYHTPGYQTFAEAGAAGMRGAFAQNSRAFAVFGYDFCEVSSDGSVSVIGPVDGDEHPATICSNGFELFVTSGGRGYIYNLTSGTFDVVVGLVATMGDFLDGFFIALDTTVLPSRLRISDYYDGTTWPPLQVRVRAAASDAWSAMVVAHKQIWLMGTETYEVWFNSGAAPFPFQPVQDIVFTQGTAAPYTMKVVGETVMWLSANAQGHGMVMLANQYAPQRVSEHALEFAIKSFTTIRDAVSMVYQDGGHTFYVLTFPTEQQTWVYDLSTNMWHQRAFWNTETTSGSAHFEAWRPLFFMSAFGKLLAGDFQQGKLYELSTTIYKDDGVALRRVRRAPHLQSGQKMIFYRRIELDMMVGEGLTSGVGSDPQMTMRYSNDGGRTFGNERSCGYGKKGEFGTRVFWNQLGSSRDRVFEIATADPVPQCWVAAYIDFEVGTS